MLGLLMVVSILGSDAWTASGVATMTSSGQDVDLSTLRAEASAGEVRRMYYFMKAR
jgi:hypothetical protein